MRLRSGLPAFALLLCVSVAPAAAQNCTLLRNKRIESLKLNNVSYAGRGGVSYRGRPVSVTLAWGSEPARAAAALLAALLRHVRLYSGVRLLQVPPTIADLALNERVKLSPSAIYKDLVISVSTAWEPRKPRPWHPHANEACGLAGPRLQEYGASMVPARCRLFAWLPDQRQPSGCHHDVRLLFYANTSALSERCHFVSADNKLDSVAEVLSVYGCNAALKLLKERAHAAATPLRTRLVNRTEFLLALRTANHSFLFLDYDMWQDVANVSVVVPPPCETVDFDCKQELDSAIAMRVADVNILQAYAPELFRFVHDFNPSHKSLRNILERQASGVDIEEAACEWALNNKSYLYSYSDSKYDLRTYDVRVAYCIDDSDFDFFLKMVPIVMKYIRNQTIPAGWNLTLTYIDLNRSDDLTKKIDDLMKTEVVYRQLGVVSLIAENTTAASALAATSNLPLMMADVVPENSVASSTWRVAGRPLHIAHALLHFVRQAGWTRVAVLSQNTQLADDYYAVLEDQPKIIFKKFPFQTNLSSEQAQKVLKDLQDQNARIVFINADSQAALTILAEATALHMGYKDGVVWIARDWRQNNVVDCIHFSLSFWVRGVEDIPNDSRGQLRDTLKLWPNQTWPPRAVPLADALLTLSICFKYVFQRDQHMQQDLRNGEMIRSFGQCVNDTPVTGVSQLPRYKDRSIEETFVFVDLWRDGKFEQRLARWRVNMTSVVVPTDAVILGVDLPRSDGASHCCLTYGDKFYPKCLDIPCFCTPLLVIATVLLIRRVLLQHLKRLQQKQHIEMIARRRHVATALAAYLVERDALELLEELGAGRFGSVRLARLRTPGRAPRYIAAKALRDNAASVEESEFLREACMIASLDHAHVVRLVGVCIADGPPLVLMELAFFGDLLGYMRARRHLVEDTSLEALADDSEAEHVSAGALTRLAREAAEALEYLSKRGVVHRDVRAANCLVDVRRSLKLADFGMARDTVVGADGAPEYACRRRGLFPVLWMAPESLAHGVFSAASDVWALGVLVLELVTLGVRPYGTMSPLRVLEYVAAGGSPPLPLDATPQTRGLVRLCWAHSAERRPSAAEVAAYLSARPLALRPALLSEHNEPVDADSGFGESPSTELLPPESPLHSLDQLKDLAASH